MKLNFYSDPGHGWLRVPLALLDKLGLVDKISPYSYMQGPWAYLEEDCDASEFLAEMRRQGVRVSFREINCPHNYSRIRTFPQYSGRRVAAQLATPWAPGVIVELYRHAYTLLAQEGRRGWRAARVSDGLEFFIRAAQLAEAKPVAHENKTGL